MKSLWQWMALACLCVPPAWGQADLEAWLPPEAQVRATLLQSPALQAALSHREALRARARATEVGSAEWGLRLSEPQRRVQDPLQRFREQVVQVERPLRAWGKATLDAGLAEQGREVARIGYADAWHETSRDLMQHWFEALRSAREWQHAQAVRALAATLDAHVQARLRHGDVSSLDASLARAEVQRADAELALAQAQASASQTQLLRRYPGLPQPQWPLEAGQPALRIPDAHEVETLREAFLGHHHGLNLLRAQAQYQQRMAERVARDRLPDPTVGVFRSRERAGVEQVQGVSLAFALSGDYRAALAQASAADALVLQEQVQHLTAQLQGEFEARWQLLRHQQTAVAALEAATASQTLAAEKSFRAYQLGEHSMTELVQNRRLAQTQQLELAKLKLEQVKTWALLQLDLHRIWDLD